MVHWDGQLLITTCLYPCPNFLCLFHMKAGLLFAHHGRKILRKADCQLQPMSTNILYTCTILLNCALVSLGYNTSLWATDFGTNSHLSNPSSAYVLMMYHPPASFRYLHW